MKEEKLVKGKTTSDKSFSVKWMYALAGGGLAILLVAAALTAFFWHAHKLEQRQALLISRYWQTYLADHYAAHGSWDAVALLVEQTVKGLEWAVDGRIRLKIVNFEGEPVFDSDLAGDRTDQSVWKGAGQEVKSDLIHDTNRTRQDAGQTGHGLHPVLVDGQIVGFYQSDYDGNISLPGWLWAVFLLIVVAGSAGSMFISRRMLRSIAEPLVNISDKLDHISSRNRRIRAKLNTVKNCQTTASDVMEDHLVNSLPVMIMEKLSRLEGELDLLERVRKTMVADIAHELRTPLAILRAKLENALYREESIPPEQIIVMHDEVYRMSKLIRDLNSLVIAETGQLPLERSWFSLKSLFEQLVELMMPEAEEKGISITMSGFDSPVYIYADRERLQQVFVNLSSNASRYARSRIEVVCSQTDTHIYIEVRDDGIGIEEEDLPHVFDRFYRSSLEGGRGSAGLGLGLAIVKEFVQAHGGDVSVESRWNEGCKFKVVLPVFQEQE